MVFTSVYIPELTIQAAQTSTDSNLTKPFGEKISYNTTDKTIDVVWENAGDDYTYCISITGQDTSYEKVYDDLPCTEQKFKYNENDGNWGGVYRVELRCKKGDSYSEAVSKSITISDTNEKDTISDIEESDTVSDTEESDTTSAAEESDTVSESEESNTVEEETGAEETALELKTDQAEKDLDDDEDSVEPDADGDILINSDKDLSGIATDGTVLNGWKVWTDAGITAEGSTDSTVKFTYPSGKCTTDWALQFQTEPNINIATGTYYTLSFTAQSSIPRSIEVCMGEEGGGYSRNNKLDYKLPANQKTEITYVFAAEVTALRKIQFLLGTLDSDKSPFWEQEGGHTLTISKVSLVQAGSDETKGANVQTANKDGLNEEIEACSELKEQDYSEDTWSDFETALNAAKNVAGSSSATQKDADEALTDLQIEKALLLPADYEPPADPVTMADPINFEKTQMETYRSQDDGDWGGDNNVQFKYDNTVATITADNFGWGDWGVQWKLLNLLSDAENNVFEFDVTSTIDKSIQYKNENSGAVEKIELKAGELTHIARRVAGKTFKVAFDLSGGGAGTLTFSNMKFGEELAYYNFEEAVHAGNLELYVGSDWAGASATGEADGTEYMIKAENFGSENEWGIQLILKQFIQIKKTATYKIHATIESSVDKDITIKLANPENDDDVLAIVEKLSLEANTPKEVELESELWSKELASTLIFACGNKPGVEGTIKISKLWVVSNKASAQDAPKLTTVRKNDKKNGYRIGDNVEIQFPAEAVDWAESITSVKANNKTLEYTLSTQDKKITVDKSAFTKYDVYDFVIEADNYTDAEIRVPVYAASVDHEDWEKEWGDEFDGDSLDLTKWDYEIGIKSGDDQTSDAPAYWGNNEKEYYTKEAAAIQDGKLVITANAITDEMRQKYNITDNTVKYTSARIRTVSEDGSKTLYATTYGRIEAMMELPNATGYWPAFWGLPTQETIDIYGTWAASGELDIMEAVGQDGNYVNGTIHYGSQWPNNVHSGGTHYMEEGDSIANAHLYAVEWEPGELRWYVDDILYHVENNWYAKTSGASTNYAYPAPFDEDFYILLNLAVGGEYVGNKEPGQEELGRSMKVDYVRVYKDNNADYGKQPDVPDVDRDVEFFEKNKQYADEEGNYIKDAPFETLKDHQMGAGGTVEPGLGYWSSATDTGNGAATIIEVVERDGVKYAKINVTKTGANNYDVQLIQHVPLAKGYPYKLTFDAYTDAEGGRNFSVAPKGDADNGWVGYDSGITADLTGNVQSFEHIFTMSKDSDPTARIEMNIGNATGPVYVGNVRLVALTKEELEEIENEKQNGKKTPLDNGEHIYNGEFDQSTGRFAYWNKVGEYTVDTSKRSMKAMIDNSSNLDDTALKQPGIQLLEGDDYKLTLKAKADSPKNIKVGLYSKEGAVYAEKTYRITTEMEELALEFTMDKKVTDEEAVLIIAFGGDTISVEIDAVSMKRTSNRNVEWNASMLYPLGGETWSEYTYYVYAETMDRTVPADGIITEELAPATNNYDYMIYKNVSIKKGYTYDLSFDIKTSLNDQIITASVQQDNTWDTLTEETITTTTDWQTIKKTFAATTEGAINLKFLLSDASNKECTVSLQNVSLKMVGAPYLVLNRIPAEMLVGDTLQLDVKHAIEVKPDYEVYTYKSNNASVATVSESGLITAVAKGSATITVTSGAGAVEHFTINVVTALSKGDKTELNKSLAEYNEYKETDYTAESWKVFAQALAAAQAVADDPDATQKDVDNALSDLKKAAEALEKADQPILVKKGLWIETIPDQIYTGAAIEPAVIHVYDGATLLKEKIDYTITYKKNINVGPAEVIVKGKGNYAKTHVENFNIVPKNINDADISTADVYAILSSSGTVKIPKVTLKYGKKTLKAATAAKENDYSVEYPNIQDENGSNVTGHYAITVTGNGNYMGTREIGYDVLPNDIVMMSKVTVKLNKTTVSYADNKETERPIVESVTYGKGAKMATLIEDKHFEVSYVDTDKVGKAAVVVTAKNGSGYYGSKSQTYTVTGTAFKAKDFVVRGISPEGYTYTGSAITVDDLKVSAKNSQKELVEGQDYNVTYSKNENVGTATVTLTGNGGYTGKFTTKFKINKMELGKKNEAGSGLVWSCDQSAVHTKSKAVPKFTLTYNGTPLTEKKDYKVSCKQNAAVTNGKTAEITITGTGNYTGTITENYEVTAPEASTIYAVASDVVVPKQLKKLKASIKVYEESTGKALKAGTDYEKNFELYILENGTKRAVTEGDLKEDTVIYTVVTLKGNYAASGETTTIETSFRLYKTKASNFMVEKIDLQNYTGKEIEPEVTVYADKAKTKKLTKGEDYRVSYSNNIKKGTAKVTITGIGNGYGGTKTVTFKIGTKNMDENTNWAAKTAESIKSFFRNMF